jgi:hypothetical protein
MKSTKAKLAVVVLLAAAGCAHYSKVATTSDIGIRRGDVAAVTPASPLRAHGDAGVTATKSGNSIDAVMLASDSVAPTTQPAAVEQPALPSGHPALPSGHPALPQAQDQPTPALPSGHPDISKMQQQRQQGDLPALPSGHPDINAMQKAAPTTQPVIGVITLQADPAASGKATIAGNPVTIEVYRNGVVVGSIDTKLDEKGQVSVDSVPLGGDYQVVVRGPGARAPRNVRNPQASAAEIPGQWTPADQVDDQQPAQAAAASTLDSTQIAKAVGGVGGLLIFLLGGAFLFMRSPSKAKNGR